MKKVNLVDIAIFVAITLALIIGALTYNHFRTTAGKQIKSESKIAFQIFIRGVTLTTPENPVKVGENAFITIRNVPYTYLPVVDSKMETKKVVISNPAGKPAGLIVDDYSQLCMYDMVVTVTDTCKITDEGVVIGGNKIKIGLPITLEGFAYKFNGTVSDIRIIKDNPQGAPQQGMPQGQPQGAPQPNKNVAPQQQGQPQVAPAPQKDLHQCLKHLLKNRKLDKEIL